MIKFGSRARVIKDNLFQTPEGITTKYHRCKNNGVISSIKVSNNTKQKANSSKFNGTKLFLYTLLDNKEHILDIEKDTDYYHYYKKSNYGIKMPNFVCECENIKEADDLTLSKGKNLTNSVIILKKNDIYYGLLATNKNDADNILPKIREVYKSEKSWLERLQNKKKLR